MMTFFPGRKNVCHKEIEIGVNELRHKKMGKCCGTDYLVIRIGT